MIPKLYKICNIPLKMSSSFIYELGPTALNFTYLPKCLTTIDVEYD